MAIEAAATVALAVEEEGDCVAVVIDGDADEEPANAVDDVVPALAVAISAVVAALDVAAVGVVAPEPVDAAVVDAGLADPAVDVAAAVSALPAPEAVAAPAPLPVPHAASTADRQTTAPKLRTNLIGSLISGVVSFTLLS